VCVNCISDITELGEVIIYLGSRFPLTRLGDHQVGALGRATVFSVLILTSSSFSIILHHFIGRYMKSYGVHVASNEMVKVKCKVVPVL
jgi:hypothetical protein